MPYVVGLLSQEEKTDLESRGWEIEPGPRELEPEAKGALLWCSCWVDSTMFAIMTGPDWAER